MHLYFSPNSPYSRKCRIALHLTGMVDQVEQVRVDPFNDAHYRQVNPLGKVPALITGQVALFDSPIICEYLDQQGQKLHHRPALFPSPQNPNYFLIQAAHAQANGVIDAAVAIVMEKRRTTEHSVWWLERWQASIKQGVAGLTTQYIGALEAMNIAGVAVAAALGYLDFRLPEMAWREGNADLAAWFERVSAAPWMDATKPVL